MGQIVGGSAKTKRCNIRQLSQLGIPAAGEHILVSSDNSMNAAGQGNFDAYVVGDGHTAASALPLQYLADDELTESSTNPVTSRALYMALGLKTSANLLNELGSVNNAWINNGAWEVSGSRYCYLIKASDYRGWMLTVTGNGGSYDGYMAFLTSNSIVNGNVPDFSSSSASTITIPRNGTITRVIPDDTTYIYVYKGFQNIDFLPSVLSAEKPESTYYTKSVTPAFPFVGCSVDADGIVRMDANVRTSDFIAIGAGMKVSVTTAFYGNYAIAFYTDKDFGTIVGGISGTAYNRLNDYTYEAPQNGYITVSLNTSANPESSVVVDITTSEELDAKYKASFVEDNFTKTITGGHTDGYILSGTTWFSSVGVSCLVFPVHEGEKYRLTAPPDAYCRYTLVNNIFTPTLTSPQVMTGFGKIVEITIPSDCNFIVTDKYYEVSLSPSKMELLGDDISTNDIIKDIVFSSQAVESKKLSSFVQDCKHLLLANELVIYFSDFIANGLSDNDVWDSILSFINGSPASKIIIDRDLSITKALLVPSNTTVIINDVTISWSNASFFDNVFRGANLTETMATNLDNRIFPDVIDTLENIRILGVGNACIDGVPTTKITTDNYGVRTINFYFECTKNIEIGNISVNYCRGWDFCFYLSSNIYIHDIVQNSYGVGNGDGLDFRTGCHDIIVENFKGWTGDDNIALHAYSIMTEGFTARNYCWSYCKNVFQEMLDTIGITAGDIYNVSINGSYKYKGKWHNVIIICRDGTQVYNVVMNDIHTERIDSNSSENTDGAVRIYRFGTPSPDGSVHDVWINNVVCTNKANLSCLFCDIVVSNVHVNKLVQEDSGYSAYTITDESGFTITNS